jgi:hypothetical protein
MPKNKRKKRRDYAASDEAKVVKKTKKFNWKRLLILCGEFVVVFAIYQLFVAFEQIAIMWIYIIIACGLFVAYIATNREFSRAIPSEDQLPEDWTDEQKHEFITETKKRREKSKPFVMLMTPFVVTIMIDVVYLFYIK